MSKRSVSGPKTTDPTQINLTRLLSRLEHSVLSADADPQLRKFSYERAKVGANLEYARTLLLRLEHDSAGVKTQSRKQAVQTDLQSKRELIKRLNQRLYDLNQLDESDDDSEDSIPEDNGEDVLREFAPAVKDTSDTLDTEHDATIQNPALQAAAANLTSTLRSRTSQPSSTLADRGATTSSSLFPPGASTATISTDPSLHQTETLLTHNRTEQEAITSSLLQMASALKSQSLKFSETLETADKEVLERALEGLDKSATGMEATQGNMGRLRRMTEGRGWLGRMMMYAWIAGLWVVAFAIVFVMPKLRF
ncbi:hypothetical protein BJ546DRAFT_880657 [Cryomyces antarcticus]